MILQISKISKITEVKICQILKFSMKNEFMKARNMKDIS